MSNFKVKYLDSTGNTAEEEFEAPDIETLKKDLEDSDIKTIVSIECTSSSDGDVFVRTEASSSSETPTTPQKFVVEGGKIVELSNGLKIMLDRAGNVYEMKWEESTIEDLINSGYKLVNGKGETVSNLKNINVQKAVWVRQSK